MVKSYRRSTKIALIVGILVILALISYFIRNVVGLNFHLYSVSFGPFFEEAFKGAVILLFFTLIFKNSDLKERLDTRRNWFIGGVLIGLFIGLYEAFIEYSPSLYRIIPTFNHIFWSAIVATGIWFYINSEGEWKLLKLTIPYGTASISHILWNYHSYLIKAKGQEAIFGAITWIIILASLVFIWKVDEF